MKFFQYSKFICNSSTENVERDFSITVPTNNLQYDPKSRGRITLFK